MLNDEHAEQVEPGGSPAGSGSLRVLVTGGTGRLGRSVVEGLAAQGHEPVAVDLVPGRSGGPGAAGEVFPADLTLPGEAYAAIARYRPDAVVHLAAIAVPFSRTEHTIYATNTALAFNVMQAAVDLGVERVIVASSPTVIGYGNPAGWAPRYLPLDEDHPVAPWNAYALSKLAAETTMRMFAARHGADIGFAAFRPCFVIAPEDWSGSATQDGRTITERLDTPALAAVSLFNYLDARDGAGFVTRLVERCGEIPNGEVFFVGADDALVRGSLPDTLGEHVPATRPRLAALAPDGSVFSNAKAKRLLGWSPERSWRTELG